MRQRLAQLVAVIAFVFLIWFGFTTAPERADNLGDGAVRFEYQISDFSTGLEIPWDIALSSDEVFVTERPGRLKVFDRSGEIRHTVPVPQVTSQSESGLLGIALHPKFTTSRTLYLYYTASAGSRVVNRVVRFSYHNGTLVDETVIVDNLPASAIHGGGRLRFGPDGKLWVLVGDAAEPSLAQKTDSLAGKVLRMNDDGSAPADNPMSGSLVYSRGHRNPQGIGWHPDTGEAIITEHGNAAFDEINLIKPGANYGWPDEKRCDSTNPDFTNPILCSDESTWAPSGAAFADRSFFFAGLRGSLLERLEIRDGTVVNRERVIDGSYGRLRAVTAGPDNTLYVSTSNRDGRGTPREGDDRILKITIKEVR